MTDRFEYELDTTVPREAWTREMAANIAAARQWMLVAAVWLGLAILSACVGAWRGRAATRSVSGFLTRRAGCGPSPM